jgi:hypothetical protein
MGTLGLIDPANGWWFGRQSLGRRGQPSECALVYAMGCGSRCSGPRTNRPDDLVGFFLQVLGAVKRITPPCAPLI